MSGSNWRKFCKDRCGLIASLFAAGFLTVSTVQLARTWQWEIEYDANRNAADYAADAENDISVKCAGLSGQPLDDCADEINDAARNNQRNEYDLAAQQTMALWTAIMGGMSVLGVCLSGVGVYLVWTTFKETQSASKSSADAAKAAADTLDSYIARERAILKFGGAHFEFLDSSPTPSGFVVELRNLGPAPANIYWIEWEYVKGPIWPKNLRFGQYRADTIEKEDRSPHLGIDDLDDEYEFWLAVSVTYKTLGSQTFTIHAGYRIVYNLTDGYNSGRFKAERDVLANTPMDT